MAASDGPGHVPTWPQVRAFGQHAEGVGLHSLWVCDHLLSGPPDDGIHEGWTILAALAASTRRLELVSRWLRRSAKPTQVSGPGCSRRHELHVLPRRKPSFDAVLACRRLGASDTHRSTLPDPGLLANDAEDRGGEAFVLVGVTGIEPVTSAVTLL